MAVWTTSGEFVFIAILGGTGHVFAPFIGAIVFSVIRTFAIQEAPHFWQMTLGVVPVSYTHLTGLDAVVDNVAAARYVADTRPNIKTVASIQQNYAWGQDSWADFSLSLKQLLPNVTVVSEQWPKPVSYTHLDVYKRQPEASAVIRVDGKSQASQFRYRRNLRCPRFLG